MIKRRKIEKGWKDGISRLMNGKEGIKRRKNRPNKVKKNNDAEEENKEEGRKSRLVRVEILKRRKIKGKKISSQILESGLSTWR